MLAIIERNANSHTLACDIANPAERVELSSGLPGDRPGKGKMRRLPAQKKHIQNSGKKLKWRYLKEANREKEIYPPRFLVKIFDTCFNSPTHHDRFQFWVLAFNTIK